MWRRESRFRGALAKTVDEDAACRAAGAMMTCSAPNAQTLVLVVGSAVFVAVANAAGGLASQHAGSARRTDCGQQSCECVAGPMPQPGRIAQALVAAPRAGSSIISVTASAIRRICLMTGVTLGQSSRKRTALWGGQQPTRLARLGFVREEEAACPRGR